MNTIRLFNRVVPTTTASKKLTFDEVNTISSKIGIIVHPDVCDKRVLKWIELQSVDLLN